MNRRRIRRLITFLRDLPPERFDMDTWIDKIDRDVIDTPTGRPQPTWRPRAHDCQTAACLAGYTILLARDYTPLTRDDGLFGYAYSKSRLTGRTLRTATAAQRLLGLTDAEAASVFLPHKWPDDLRAQYAALEEGWWYHQPRATERRLQRKALALGIARLERLLETGR